MGTIFTATDSTRGQELWISYGTPGSTFLLKDIRPNLASSNPLILGNLLVAGVADRSRVLFLANDGTGGDEIWVTDGTAAGTVQFKDINPGAAGSFASNWISVGDRAVFAATDADNGRELWVSDGTAAGTTLLTNLAAGAAGSNPVFLGYLEVNGATDLTQALFLLDNGATGREIWVTDGTVAGTVLLTDINPTTGSANPTPWTAVNGHAVFTANDGTSGQELWVSDGTGATTALLLDAAAGAAGSDPELLGPLLVAGVPDPDRLLFALDNITNGIELWTTDGTAAGTTLFKDINPGAGGSAPTPWTAVNGRAVFVADNGANGPELWVSDGTAAGTTLLLDAQPGVTGSSPDLLGYLAVGGTVDFNRLLFLLDDGTNGPELWVTNGTAAGTTLFKDINPGAGGSQASAWSTVNGRAVFIADDGTSGRELWVSDGTAAGTTRLRDVRAGAESSNPSLLGYLAVNGATDPNQLLFLMDDGATGQEIWVTDGTEAGTVLFKDINPGAGASFASPGTEFEPVTADVSGATGPVVLDLGAGGATNNAIGSGFADTLSGNANPNSLTGGDGADTLNGLGGNDTLDGGEGDDTLNGGGGDDRLIGGGGANSATFSNIRGASEVRFIPGTNEIIVLGPDGIDTTSNVQTLVFSDRTTTAIGPSGAQHLFPFTFSATGVDGIMVGDAHGGTVPGVTDEFIFPTPENLNVAAGIPNVFIRTGTGQDAVTVLSGRNVVDAYLGSNFITLGSGQDTVFLDARGGGVTWQTVVNFEVGDDVTLWGFIDGVSLGADRASWLDSAGAPGFSGLTIHTRIDGGPTINASITFAGLTPADANSLALNIGTVGGNPYLNITRI